MRRLLAAVVLALMVSAANPPLRGQELRATSIGMPAKIEQLVLPGPELEVKALADRRQPIVLRIVKSYPHGTAFRYDLIYYGLDPGEYDLRDYLRRKDGSSTAGLPPLRVKIESILGPGQVLPTELEPRPSPTLGGYRVALVVLGILWVLGVILILVVRRRRQEQVSLAARPLTLADQLRPLVERGVAGKLTVPQCAELERMLLAYWRKRLRVDGTRPAEAFAVLRAHPAAGTLLEQLESWLHRPGHNETIDVAALLRPYRDAPPEAGDMTKQAEADRLTSARV
jgi:hypothetical protein